MESIDHRLDPVEDFLVNRKSGHCEYFASALALLLRSVNIRSRVVNGFKGGDWNELTETLNVRQKHAHSWVEAYVGLRTPDRIPIWITLDPTPAAERKQSIAQVGGIAGNFRPLTDLDSPYLGLLCRRLRWRPPGPADLRPDAHDGQAKSKISMSSWAIG